MNFTLAGREILCGIQNESGGFVEKRLVILYQNAPLLLALLTSLSFCSLSWFFKRDPIFDECNFIKMTVMVPFVTREAFNKIV